MNKDEIFFSEKGQIGKKNVPLAPTYAQGGLIAPNGKPSNLTPEQYKLVRTKAFKDWFGDWENDPENASKVVDENGEPLVVWHASDNLFDVFRSTRGANLYGIYFSQNKESVRKYGKIRRRFFLNVRNPEVPKIWFHSVIDAYLLERMKRQNFDGAFWMRKNPEKNKIEFYEIVVFNPNRIKLADGTNTTFDGNNPDIRFAEGGMTYREYVDTQFNENEDRYLPSGYLDEFQVQQADKNEYPILFKKKNGLEYRIKNNDSSVVVFDNENQVAYADNKAIMVASTYQKRGIGLELVRILKERNPSHRFGSMTPEGFNLMGKYYDTYIAKNPDIQFSKGGRTIAQTPAPMSERVKGSKVNPKGSSKSGESARNISFSQSTIDAITEKVEQHNRTNPDKKVTLAVAKAVVRRGMGAYSASHRPTISGGKPNSRVAWGLARLNAFLYKVKNGKSKSGRYSQDNDLLDELGIKHQTYQEGGNLNVLLAPNGKPTNLTPEQYKLVRTKAFKDWFGDWENDPKNASKVIDENGEPLVCYHGTYVEHPFYIFDFDKADLGFHFGTHEQAKNRSETKIFFQNRKSMVNSFFLNIKTIFETSDIGEWEYPQRYVDMFVSDGLITESDAKRKGFYRLIHREDNKQIREYLLNKYGKFIGFVYDNKYEGKGKSFVVLNANQIKLADGTNTTFDANNPDIRFEQGGEVQALGFNERELEDWREENRVKKRAVQNPIVSESAQKLSQGEITQEQYLEIVKKNNPIYKFKEVPKLPTLKEIVGSLKSNQIQTGIIGFTKFLEDNQYVASRLDIPAYYNYDVWVVSVHDGTKEGQAIGYGQTAYLKDVTFKTSPKTALRIATGLADKSTFARMFGYWINKDPNEVREMAVKYLNDPSWIQVGMNPYRHSWFYDKADGMPLVKADYVIQVGALVLAKNAVKTSPSDPMFAVDKSNPEIKFLKGGQTSNLIAPNGRVSNLNAKQYELVRTPEFKKWFGDWEKPTRYTGYFVSDPDELKEKYPSDLPIKFYHHSTISYGNQAFDKREGNIKSLKIKGRLTTEKVDVLLVENTESENKHPHITLATAEGIRAFEANKEIENNLASIKPLRGSVLCVFANFIREDVSKVVDENGEPLVVYRGMPAKRKFGNIFKYNVNLFGTQGVGGRMTNKFAFYFTDNKNVAEGYGYNLSDTDEFIVKQYFLNIKNMFEAFSEPNQYKMRASELYDLAVKSEGSDMVEVSPLNSLNANGSKKFIRYREDDNDFNWRYQLEKQNPERHYRRNIYEFFVDWDKKTNNQSFWRFLLKDLLKYDGLVFYETTHATLGWENNEPILKYDVMPKTYAVWDSNQIKLADGTNTTFDSDNPDIRFEDGGEIDYSEYQTSVIAITNEKNQILILQRGSTAPWMPNKWSLVGGGVDKGENPTEAIVRETFEEVGLVVKKPKFVNTKNTADSGMIHYFTATIPYAQKVFLDYENQDYAWVDLDTFGHYDYVPYVREFIETILKKFTRR